MITTSWIEAEGTDGKGGRAVIIGSDEKGLPSIPVGYGVVQTERDEYNGLMRYICRKAERTDGKE